MQFMTEIALNKINDLVGSINSEIYTTHINNEEKMNKDIIKTIDEQVGKKDYQTNVKAKMTDWEMWDYPGFNKLSTILVKIIKGLGAHKKCSNVKFNIVDMWGCKYKDGDYTISHNHWPSVWSLAYYLYPPKNCPELIFTEFNHVVKPEHGMLVIFPGHYLHQVNKKAFEGYRYVVSANVR